MTPNDLIALAKRGDRDAFGKIYALLKTSVWRWAYRSLQDPTATEEIVGDCFVAMICQLDELPDELPALAGWLRSVAHHKSCDAIRRNQTRRNGLRILTARELVSEQTSQSPSQSLEQAELAAQVHEALERLPDEYQIVIQWRYLDELKVEEIASRLDQSVSATNSLLYRARTKLRTTLRCGHGSEPSRQSSSSVQAASARGSVE